MKLCKHINYYTSSVHSALEIRITKSFVNKILSLQVCGQFYIFPDCLLVFEKGGLEIKKEDIKRILIDIVCLSLTEVFFIGLRIFPQTGVFRRCDLLINISPI
jgi:hypothetical protein